jgi:phage tail sheath protein FI
MPITPTYPGVYIEELPSSVHTITGVATSITAFIGRANRGPVNTPITINSYAEFERTFGGLWAQSTMSFAVSDFFANGGSQAVIVRLATASAETGKIQLPHDAAAHGSPPPPNSFSSLLLEAANPGSWSDTLSVIVDHKTKDPNDVTLFNLTATLQDPTQTQVLATEKYVNLSVDPTNSRYVAKTLAQNSALLVVQQDARGDDEVPAVRPADTLAISSPPQSVPAPVFAVGGSDGGALTDADFTGPNTQANKLGLYALENVDLFNILCIPPYLEEDDVSTALVGKAAEYCEQRRAFYIIDPPSGWTTLQTALKQFTDANTDFIGTRSDHAAMYFPRVLEPNPLQDNQLDTFVPCGIVAGILARTDAQRGVWKAPAGQETGLNGVPQLAVPLTDAENGQLNPLGLNCLRSFPIIGRVVWGARTLQGADQLESQWKYVPVRRTALFIEESLYRGTKWVVFEPNDETLWANIRLNVGAFMQSLFRKGAFFGSTPNQAYFVKCDSETTTQNDIDQGIVNILVGFAPLKPAEFVIIQIQQMSGQLQV